MTIAHISPLPFTGGGSAGQVNGPPTAANGHDYNRAEQASAIASVPRAAYVNAYGPGFPWWTGTGSNGTPTSSAQGALFGPDGATPNAHGFNFLASKIAAELAQMRVYLPRVRGRV